MPEYGSLRSKEELPLQPIPEEVWKFILDRRNIPSVLAHILRGEAWVVEVQKDGSEHGYWKELGEPAMNNKGVDYFSSILQSAMSVDKIATFLTPEEVNRMAKQMRLDITYALMDKADEFDIDTSPSNLSIILNRIDHFYFANLTAARKGTLLEVLKPMVKREEIYKPTEKKGMLARILPTGGE